MPSKVRSLGIRHRQRLVASGNNFGAVSSSRIPLLHVQYAIFFLYVSKSKIKFKGYHAKPNFLSYTLMYCKVGGAQRFLPHVVT